MQLQDIYDQLANSELRQHFIGSDGEGIRAEDFSKLFPSIQLGLTELHKRFLLREDTVTLALEVGRISYVVDKRNSVRVATGPGYLIDTVESPYQENLMKIERVYDAAGAELPINILDNILALRTTSYNTLVVPDTLIDTTATLRVVYRADHPKIKDYLANSAPLVTEIFLPSTHLEALLFYVASRYNNPRGSDGEFHEGNNYAAKFEAACVLLEQLNFEMDNDSSLKDERFYREGWV